MQRFSWSWATLLFGSHFVRDRIPAQPAPRAPLSAEVLELRLQIVATTELLSWHSESVQNADRRLFWQGLVLRASILLDVILCGLSLWLWLGRFRAPAEAIEEPPSPGVPPSPTLVRPTFFTTNRPRAPTTGLRGRPT